MNAAPTGGFGMALMNPQPRIGIGYDLHRLVDGRELRLGGITIDHPKGLLGQSDADVVLHAVTDALLGGAGMPDIGDLFPDSDPRHKGADSRMLLTSVVERIAEQGLKPANIDVIVHAEQPKLTGHKRRMAESIARLVGLSADMVCVKAKTNEGLGEIGRGEAIACTAAALLVPI